MGQNPWGYYLASQIDWHFKFKYCGYEQPSSPDFCVAPHVRDEYLFHYIIHGKGAFVCDGKTYSLHSSDLFLIIPSKVVSYYADPTDPFQLCWIAFDVQNAEALLSLMDFSIDHPVRTLPPFSFIDHTIHAMVEIIHKEQCYNEFIIQSLLYKFIFQVIESAHPESKDNRKMLANLRKIKYIHAAKEYMDLNYMQSIHVQDVVNKIGLERTYFSKIFKQEAGVTIQQYLNNVRLNQSKALLEQTDYSIREICSYVGLSDPLYFCKVFKHTFGVSPSQYRQSYASIVT